MVNRAATVDSTGIKWVNEEEFRIMAEQSIPFRCIILEKGRLKPSSSCSWYVLDNHNKWI